MEQKMLNRIRRMAGVSEDFTPPPRKVVKEDVVPGTSAVKEGGKHLFYLVTGAKQGDELGDIFTEVDTQGLVNIVLGVWSGTDKQNNRAQVDEFELFPHEKQKEALNLARTRLAKVGGGEKLKEFQMEVGVSAQNPDATPVPSPDEMKFGSEAHVCKVCSNAACKCPKPEQEEFDHAEMDADSEMDVDYNQPCEHGHMNCSTEEMGPCSDEMAVGDEDADVAMDDVGDEDMDVDQDRMVDVGDDEDFDVSELGDQADDWDNLVGRRSRDEISDEQFQTEAVKVTGKPVSWKNAQKVLKKMKKNALEKQKVKEGVHYHTDDHYPSYSDTNKDKPINVVASYDTVFDKNAKKEEDYEMANDVTKVKVPAKVVSELKRVIGEVEAEAEKAKPRDWERSNYYADTAEAFKIVLGFLEMKTVEGLKRAQIYSQRMNSASRALMPDLTWKFIVDGGQKRSLKSYVSDVKDFPVTGKPMDTIPVKTLNKNTHTE